ncbi:MAG: InlB B-repeat-containing protein, partial [Clostridia bacterium]|nr:InlB B-repeat-containing protein [Clostridia bacterium]
QNSAYRFTSYEWVYSWNVKVRDDVKEGDTGMSFTKTGFWKCGDYKNDTKSLNHNGRNGTLSILERPANATADDDYNTLVSATKSMYVYWGSYNEVFFEDLDHTFTCGKNPAAGTVKTYNVTFLENDGTELSAKEYVSGAKVEIPAEVDGQLGWADTATGKLADLTDYTASKKVTFKRVLDTDEFDVVVNLGGGDYGDTVLPDNATVENGNLVIKAGLNEEVDLTKLPVPEKEGYTGEWSADKVTVDSINGAEAKINWTAKKYTVNFYNAKGDATPVDTITVEYKKAATTKLITAPEGYKFAGWADAATDEIASTSQSFQYTYAEDKDFYAVWTAYDSSITVMVRDYDNEGTWKVGAVTYGDASATALSSTVVNNLLAKAAASINATAADVYTDEALTEQAAKAKAALNYMAQDKLVETALGSLPAAYAKTGNLADLTEEELNKVLDYVSNSDKYVAESKNGVYTIYEKSAFVFGGDKKFYLSTTLDFNVTWKVPVFDAAAGEFTDYTETTGTASTLATGDAKYVYKTTLKTDADTTPPAGYTFKGWKNEATDEYVDYNANVGITLDNSFDRDVVLVADFQETEYTIIFDVQNGEGDGKLTHSDTFKVGEAVTLDGATFVNGYGEDSSLPVIDVENSEQPQKFMNMNGYKFTGWKLGKGADAVDVTFPTEEITYEMLEAYATGTTITIYGQWEALEYELRFFYATPDTDLSADAADRKYAEPIVVKYKTGEVINRDLDEETLAKISENAPEGYRFYQWVKLDGSVIDRKMPAYGLDLYGSYLKQRILLYVDYNNNRVDEEGKPLPLEETMAVTPIITNNPILYGDDVERLPDIEAGIEMGVGTEVKRSLITTGDRPGENYEVVGWNIYHVENGANVFDKNNWKPGVNDEGTTNAYTTLIYQPEWKHHTEFFFRVYGTDGKIYMALGKNFKLYYWTNNYISNRKEAAVNEDPENLVILLFLPEFENWDWNRFFDFEMWSNVTLRFDPVYAPKSMFTIDAFIGLMKALGNLIGSLF